MSASAVLSPRPAEIEPEVEPESAVVVGLDFDALLELLAPSGRPWMQRMVRPLAVSGWVRLRGVPQWAAGWGAGPGGQWCAW